MIDDHRDYGDETSYEDDRLDDTAIENITQVYYDAEGWAGFRDEVLS